DAPVHGLLVVPGGMEAAVIADAQSGCAEIRQRVKEILRLLRHRIDAVGWDLVVGEWRAGERVLDDSPRQQTAEVSAVPGCQRRVGVHRALRAIDGVLVIGEEERFVLADGAAEAYSAVVVDAKRG